MIKNTYINNKAFTLIEMALVSIIIATSLSAVVPIYTKTVYKKTGEKISLDISAIQEAGRAFFIANGRWPIDIDELKTNNFLPSTWGAINPFNNNYTISSNANSFTVTSQLNTRVIGQVSSSLPTSVINGEILSSTVLVPGSLAETGLPAGIVVTWTGAISNIPEGFVLCDGTNGTPDLRNSFIIGASADVSGEAQTNVSGVFNKRGGNSTINLNHSHELAGEALAHNHQVSTKNWGEYNQHSFSTKCAEIMVPLYTPMMAFPPVPDPNPGCQPHYTPSNGTVVNTGDRQTAIQGTAQDAGNTAQAILNPYYALVFIMKT